MLLFITGDKPITPPINKRDPHWIAIFIGWLVDFSLRLLVQVGAAWLGLSAFFNTPELTYLPHLVIIALLLAATAAGGFVAARIADQAPMLNGLLVGVTGILAGAVSNPGLVPVPQLLVITQVLSLASGALGGLLARLTAPPQAVP